MSAETQKTAAKRARYKLAASMLTTYGYAIMGVSAVQPLLMEHGIFAGRQIAGMALAVACQLLALYIAPKGEKP
jgi:hypothetical protein